MIRTVMIARGLSVSDLARGVDAHISAVSQVISGQLRNPRIENGIARILGIRRNVLWTN
jgi:lambda repressor-like predicted transcriptional regulator